MARTDTAVLLVTCLNGSHLLARNCSAVPGLGLRFIHVAEQVHCHGCDTVMRRVWHVRLTRGSLRWWLNVCCWVHSRVIFTDCDWSGDLCEFWLLNNYFFLLDGKDCMYHLFPNSVKRKTVSSWLNDSWYRLTHDSFRYTDFFSQWNLIIWYI